MIDDLLCYGYMRDTPFWLQCIPPPPGKRKQCSEENVNECSREEINECGGEEEEEESDESSDSASDILDESDAEEMNGSVNQPETLTVTQTSVVKSGESEEKREKK